MMILSPCLRVLINQDLKEGGTAFNDGCLILNKYSLIDVDGSFGLQITPQ
jgi:hypothetical protein